MNDNIAFLLEIEFIPGREDDARALIDEMNQSASEEPGTLNYEWNLSEDGKTMHLYERYADIAATMVHLQTLNDTFAARYMEVLKTTRWTIYGNMPDEMKAALAPFNPVYMKPIGGITR